MLNELITWILNTYLGKYLEDFNPAQLSVAFLSGEVELENVPIRKDALRSFGIPLQALAGNIGKIKLQIPVRAFRTAPWCIIIEHVYGVFGPQDLNEWDDEKEKNSDLAYKLAQLDALEAKWRVENGYSTDNYYSTSYSSWLSYGTSLATNILDNLELKIMDVHLRYEDTVTLSALPFTGGIKIGSLTAQTCDASWVPGAKTSNTQPITYKLIELNDFSVYWNRLHAEHVCGQLQSKELLQRMNEICNAEAQCFIINPISARAQCKRQRCKQAIRSKDRPRLSCEVFVQALKISLNDLQYRQMVDCMASLSQIDKIRSYKIMRPTSSVAGGVADWWRYAAKCHGYTFLSFEKRWSTLRENLRYIRLYKRLLINPNENTSAEEKQFKQHMEKCRNLEELQTMRTVCYNNVYTKELSLKTPRNINQGKGMLYHWFPNWWGWYGNGSGSNDNSTKQDETYQLLEDDLLNALEDTMENNSFSKRDAVFAYCTFVLVEGQLLLCTENVSTNTVSVCFEMEFQNLISFIEMKPRFSSYLIGISLGSVCVKDTLTKGSEFPYMVKPQLNEPMPTATSTNASAEFKRFFMKSQSVCETDQPWFQLQYEKGPSDVPTDFRLVVKSRSLDIVYNESAYAWLVLFWVRPLRHLSSAASKQTNDKLKFLKNWKHLLTERNEHRKTWSFEIDISAPRIIFVENFFEKNTAIVLVDFGRFQLLKNEAKRKESVATSDIAAGAPNISARNGADGSDDEDESFKTPCSTPPGSKNSTSESPTLVADDANVGFSKFVINNDHETGLESAFHNKIYDKYTINLMDLQVLVCKNRERSYASFKNASNFHLLNKFNISLQLERRVIYTIDPEYPSLTLFGTLQKIVAHVNEQKINDVYKILRPIKFENIYGRKEEDMQFFGNGDPHALSADREVLDVTDGDAAEISTTQNTDEDLSLSANLLVLQFAIGQIILEVQSYEKSIAELQIIGARAGIIKKLGETSITMSVHGLLLVDAIQSFGSDFELLVASHRHVGMDSVSGSLKQSEPCSPISIESPDPLAAQRPCSPFMINKAVYNIQSFKGDTGFEFDELHALIAIEINLVDAGEEHDSLLLANITFNNLDIIATQETIVELLGFLKRLTQLDSHSKTAETGAQPKPAERAADCDTEPQKAKESVSSFQYERNEISFDFHRLNILVLRTIQKDGFQVARKVGTLTMSEAKIQATVGQDISVKGSLGGIQIIDITPDGVNHQRIFSVGKDPLTDPPVLSAGNDLVASLTSEMYNSGVGSGGNDGTAPEQTNALIFKIWREKQQSTINIKIRMASVWYTHCPRFIQEINTCISQFKDSLSNFAKSLRSKATDIALGLVQHINETSGSTAVLGDQQERLPKPDTGQLSVDIILNSPVLVLPRSSQSTDVLVANLGKITAYNTHEASGYSIATQACNIDSPDGAANIWTTDNYFVDVRNINLFSLNTSQRKELRVSALPKAQEFYACNQDAVAILHDTAMLFKFTSDTHKVHNSTSGWQSKRMLAIEGSVTQMLQVSLTRAQYNQLTESLYNAMKFSFSNDIADAKYAKHKEQQQHDDNSSGKTAGEQHNGGVEADQGAAFAMDVRFAVPVFKMDLKNEHNDSLINITLCEFSICHQQRRNETDLRILLRSVLMEDLKTAPDSSYRNMVNSLSHTDHDIAARARCHMNSSASCPNLLSLSGSSGINRTFGSMPCNLDATFPVHQTVNRSACRAAPRNSDKKTAAASLALKARATADENLVIYKSKTTEITERTGAGLVSQTKTNSCIDFNCLNLIISLDRWFMVFDFFGLVGEADVRSPVAAKGADEQVDTNSGSALKMSVKSLNLILIRSEEELSRANISSAFLKITKTPNSTAVEGRLKSIALYDLTTYGQMYREKFSTAGPEALSFHYRTLQPLEPRSEQPSLATDALLQIRMSSVRYIHTKRFLVEIHLFVKELLQLQTPVIKSMQLSELGSSNKQRPLQIALEIHADSPIMLLPLSSYSDQVIVADLGEFTLSNRFHWGDDSANVISKLQKADALAEEIAQITLDVMHIDLVNINLFGGERIKRSQTSVAPQAVNAMAPNLNECLTFGNFNVLKLGNNLFKETCHLKLQVERNTDTSGSNIYPDISVKGLISKLNGLINLQQYKLIRGFLSYNLGEMIDDVYVKYTFNVCESIERLSSINKLHRPAVQEPIRNTLSVCLLLENVAILLADQACAGAGADETPSLACINFIKSALEIDTFSDGSQDIDLISREILIMDARSSSGIVVGTISSVAPASNVFKYILQPKQTDTVAASDLVQAEIHSRRRPGGAKYTILLNNMRIMAMLECIELLKNFLQEEPYKATASRAAMATQAAVLSQSLRHGTASKQSDDPGEHVEVVLNITDSEVVFVENTDTSDTNAIILKSTTVLSYKPSGVVPVSININHLEIFSCILGAEETSAQSIIDPFTLNVELRNNCLSISVQKLLCVRLSYNDLKMITKMLNSIPQQRRKAKLPDATAVTATTPIYRFEQIAPLVAMGFSQYDCCHAMELTQGRVNEAAIWLAQHKHLAGGNANAAIGSSSTAAATDPSKLEVQNVVLNASAISICIIDDCLDVDVPLLELCFSNLQINQRLKPLPTDAQSDFISEGGQMAQLVTAIASNYYNRLLSGWEPVVEPWECNAAWYIGNAVPSPLPVEEASSVAAMAAAATPRALNITVSSTKLLKFNVTSTLIELCNMVYKNWTVDYYSQTGSVRRRSPFVPFALRNLTGEPLLFKTICSQQGDIARITTVQQPPDLMANWLRVLPNETRPFDFAAATTNKWRHMDSHKLNLHQILVQICGWTLVGPVSIDKVGTYFRYATLDMQYKKRTRIVLDIAPTGSGSAQKLITVKSALHVRNRLEKRVFLKMELPHEDKMTLCCIEPGEQLSVPLRLVDAAMHFKPCLEQTTPADAQLWQTVANNKANYMNKSILAAHKRAAGDALGFCARPISWLNAESVVATTSSSMTAASAAALQQQLQQQELYTCHSASQVFHTFVGIRAQHFPNRDLAQLLPGHTITLLPPLTIKNLLCCDLLYKIGGAQLQGRLAAGEAINLYTIDPYEAFNLSITLDNYKLSGQVRIPKGHSGIVEPKLKLIDLLNRELLLRVSIQLFRGRGMEIYISAPVWIMNRTGLPLVYRQSGTSQPASGQFEEHERARVVSPLIYSFAENEGMPALEIRLGRSYGDCNPWCKSFNLHKQITYRELKAERARGCYAIGISVRRGRGTYARTTFVRLSPRFHLYNKSARKLEFAQKCDVRNHEHSIAKKLISALPGCNFPFHWPNCDEEPLLCVRIGDVQFCNWSSAIPLNEVQSLYINIRNDLGEMHFLRLEVVSADATYNLLFSDAHTLPPPIRIDNYAEVMMHFSQCGCKPYWRTPVRAQSSLAYVMDEPLGQQALWVEAPGGNSIEFPIGKIDATRHLTYANFIYIAYRETFQMDAISAADTAFDLSDSDESNGDSAPIDIGGQQLVLGVQDRRVLIMRKCAGDRSQLWLMNQHGQLEHEGSSPPSDLARAADGGSATRMVLDLEKAPNPTEYTNLVIRLPNKQRVTTQTWRFESGRLMCHANMCVQTRNGIYGLRPGCEAVLGRVESNARIRSESGVPYEQSVEYQKLRPGSGQLEVLCKMDGPIRTLQIHDVKANRNEATQLAEDPAWNHASINNKTTQAADVKRQQTTYECSLKLELPRGAGLSVITRKPSEELAYIMFENISLDVLSTSTVKSCELRVGDLQIDNQLLDTSCPVLLYSSKATPEQYALLFRAKVLPCPNANAIICEHITFELNPCMVYLEERLILKTARFFGYGGQTAQTGVPVAAATQQQLDYDNEPPQHFERALVSNSSKRYYFEHLNLAATQIRLSVFTASKLTPELVETKKAIGLTLIKFEEAVIVFDKFTLKHNFETLDLYLKAIKGHYINQIKWHAAAILGSVDFLGNPLGFANDISEGVSGLLFEGSVISLVRNVTHGISNSTAKLTETLSDSLGKVVLDEHDNETRQRILEIQTNSSSSHLAAGLKGFGFGLLGGVTSIVRHTYDGAQSDGFPGFLSGLGKGLVGTVTKPIIGVLDLASETATAVRESSRGSHRNQPDRKRLPRCVTGAPGGLLPAYSHRQSQGQQYLYIINRRHFGEKLISYEPNLCNDREAKLRLLVSTECVRIFSRCDDEPTIMFECHLSEVLSCHPLTTANVGASTASSGKVTASHYIEISTNLPKITRPRVRCQNEETAENAARCINYAKSVFDEREQSLTSE